MNSYAWIALILVYFSVNALLKIASYLLILRHKGSAFAMLTDYSDCCIIVPVYRETLVVAESVRYFQNLCKQLPGCRLVYVGTEREAIAGQNGTLALVGSTLKYEHGEVLQAPARRQYMAGQINFTLEKLQQDHPNIKKVALYNVDSRPALKDVGSNFSLLSKHEVVQQYGSYLLNFPTEISGIAAYVYANTFLWQNSWAIQFEQRNILLNQHLPWILQKFCYVVGHGLYMRISVFYKVGRFTESFHNEDMEYSCRLNAAGIHVALGVGNSHSTMALNLSDYVRQQSVWARGPLFAFFYVNWHQPSALVAAAKLFLHYVYWLGEPVLLAGVLILSFMHPFMLIPACVVIFIHAYAVAYLPNRAHFDELNQKVNWINILMAYPLFFLLHGVGPLVALLTMWRTSKYSTRKA